MTKDLKISTRESFGLTDITDQIQAVLERGNVGDTLCHVFCAHTTAALIIAENEEGLRHDLIKGFQNLVSSGPFKHAHDPSHAPSHILSSILGQEVTVATKYGRLTLGTWQRIFLVELDGPRERQVLITTIGA